MPTSKFHQEYLATIRRFHPQSIRIMIRIYGSNDHEAKLQANSRDRSRRRYWWGRCARPSCPIKTSCLVVGEVDVTHHDAFERDYVPLAMKALRENGSGYKALAVGGKTATIEGEPPKRIVVNSFDNLDQAVAAYNSAAYKEADKIGKKYGTFRVYAVEGLSHNAREHRRPVCVSKT